MNKQARKNRTQQQKRVNSQRNNAYQIEIIRYEPYQYKDKIISFLKKHLGATHEENKKLSSLTVDGGEFSLEDLEDVCLIYPKECPDVEQLTITNKQQTFFIFDNGEARLYDEKVDIEKLYKQVL